MELELENELGKGTVKKYYMGWLAPLRLFDSPAFLRRAKERGGFLIYFNPASLHLTFEEVLIPCKAIVAAPDEAAAWSAIEQVFAPAEIKRRFARLWDPKWQQQLEEFTTHYGFRRADD